MRTASTDRRIRIRQYSPDASFTSAVFTSQLGIDNFLREIFVTNDDGAYKPPPLSCLTYDKWTVWMFSWKTIKSTYLRNLPCLDGVYLLDGETVPFYLGCSKHVCRRLRSHNMPWQSAICFTMGESTLEESGRGYLEFTVGLMLLLTGVPTRNQRLDYPEYDPDKARFARAFLRKALVPLWTEFGSEIGLPNEKHLVAAKRVASVLSF